MARPVIWLAKFLPEWTVKGSMPAGAWAGVKCGASLTCTTAEVCCVGFASSASYACAPRSAGCSGGAAAATCDGPEDCPAGQVCCAGFPSGASCKTACAGFGAAELCHDNSGCGGGKTCKLCATPGGGPSFDMCVASGKCPF